MSPYVPLIISIIALTISVATILERLYTNRFKIVVKPIDSHHMANKNFLYIFAIFENKSRLSISITRIRLVYNGKKFDCRFEPAMVKETTRSNGNEVYDRITTKTLPLPINIGALGAINGYLLFDVPEGINITPDTPQLFEICTNRGKKTLSISLPSGGKYLLLKRPTPSL